MSTKTLMMPGLQLCSMQVANCIQLTCGMPRLQAGPASAFETTTITTFCKYMAQLSRQI